MQTLKVKAPAKVNLYLKVLRKRPDGFHDIETIFEKIDLCDEVVLKKRKRGIRVFCSQRGVPQDKRNLAYKAAQAVFSQTDCHRGVEISIAKNIPVAAGLGGGSSDAASVLLGLNRLFNLRFTRHRLLGLAERIGADVPFFIFKSVRALGQGKGELLSSLPIKRKNWYVLVVPAALSVSTRRMYQHLRIALTKSRWSVKIILHALKEGDLTALNKYSYNSFARILHKKYKQIQEIKKALKTSGAAAALISGSGPCVFGIAHTRKEAMAVSRRLRAKKKNWRIIVTQTYVTSK